MSDLLKIFEETTQSFEPATYDDSFEKQAAEHISEHINNRMDRLEARQDSSQKSQLRFNISLLVVGILTLAATVYGVFFK